MMLLYERKVEEGLAYFWRRAGRRGEERRGARDQKMEASERNKERGTTVRARTMEMRARGGGRRSEWLGWRVHRPSSLHISNGHGVLCTTDISSYRMCKGREDYR